MRVVRTINAALIKQLIDNEKLWDRLSEDWSQDFASWMPDVDSSIWLLVVDESEDEVVDVRGVFAFAPETHIVYRFHPAILPDKWGETKKNIQAGKLALSWLWEHTAAEKVVARSPILYPDALKWAQRVGLKREGICRNSFLKNGKLVDQYHLGINKE